LVIVNTEYFRLANVPEREHERRRRDFIETWPFAPHMMQLLEGQVLVATEAQETRDLIRVLADVFKGRGDTSPVLTVADFRLDDEATGIGALLSSVANQQHAALREKALRNLTAVREAVPSANTTVPHLAEIVSALWLRSIAVGNLAGAEPATLQIEITREAPVDGNAFSGGDRRHHREQLQHPQDWRAAGLPRGGEPVHPANGARP
jgi:hypothetical protein